MQLACSHGARRFKKRRWMETEFVHPHRVEHKREYGQWVICLTLQLLDNYSYGITGKRTCNGVKPSFTRFLAFGPKVASVAPVTPKDVGSYSRHPRALAYPSPFLDWTIPKCSRPAESIPTQSDKGKPATRSCSSQCRANPSW